MLKYTINIVETDDCIYFYAIKDKTKPIGCLEIILKENNKYLLHQIFVLEEFRNNGIANSLINKFLSWTSNRINNIEIFLQVIPSVYDFSEIKEKQNYLINWYKKFGFEIVDLNKSILFDTPIMKLLIK